MEKPRKIPAMLLSVLLVSLGAPFWYSVGIDCRDPALHKKTPTAQGEAKLARFAQHKEAHVPLCFWE